MRYLFAIAGIFAGDQWVKEQIEKKETQNVKRPVLGGRLSITKHYNKGAVLNYMENKPNIILGVSCITFGYVILLLKRILSEQGSVLMKAGISLIAGGGISNVYDRIKKGHVVDYFTINYGRLRRVIFNLADICIFVGGFFLVLGAFLGEKGSR